MSVILSAVSGRLSAEPWSVEPRLGASAEFDSNPSLINFDSRSETHVAAIFNIPLRYDADRVSLMLAPSGRISDSQGYSSLASNYEHLDLSAQYSTDLESVSLQGELARDSSLYHVGELVNGVGVRRDTAFAAADWTRALSERGQFELDANWTHVSYGQPANATTLTDYRYLSGGPTFSYALTERDTLKLLSVLGDYQSSDGVSGSKSQNLQLGLVRQLTELWSFTGTAGYSHSTNSQKIIFDGFSFGNQSSSQSGAVYTAGLTRKSEQWTLNAAASRQLTPTGFAYLSRQDSVNLNAIYALTERWDFSLSTVWQRIQNPVGSGAQFGVTTDEGRYLNVAVTANWHWTPQWLISIHAIRITQQYSPPPVTATSNGVSVDIVRQFLRHDL
jgi:hypothetical protein